MARTRIETSRILPYAPEDLCRLVGDVRAYPEFIPWIQSLRVINETPLPEAGWEGVAEAVVGWNAIREKFATRVRCAPGEGLVDVALVNGPFRALENRWSFESSAQGTLVNFMLDYEFRNRLLQGVVSVNRDKVATRVMAAFEREAHRRLGAQPANV